MPQKRSDGANVAAGDEGLGSPDVATRMERDTFALDVDHPSEDRESLGDRVQVEQPAEHRRISDPG